MNYTIASQRSDVHGGIVHISIDSLRVINIREIAPKLALQGKVYGTVIFVEFLARDYVVVPGLEQLIVRGKAKISGRRNVDCRQEYNNRREHGPASLQREVWQKQNRSQLDCDCQRHQDRRGEVLASMRKVERREQKKHRRQLCIAIVQRHHEVLGCDKGCGEPHNFRNLKRAADEGHTTCDLNHR